jgi:hypothetical protein
MALTLNEYSRELVNKILLADSQVEVKRFIDTGLKEFDTPGINGHFIIKFLDRVIEDLSEFSPMNYEAQQWANIKMARIIFSKIRRSLQPEQYK